MVRKADMAKHLATKHPVRGKVWLRRVAIFFGVTFSIVTYGFLDVTHRCVEMPNGFLIGRATVFSSLIGWAPDIAIRYPDGRIFLRGDVGMDFWDEDGFGGSIDRPRCGNGEYIYLNDIGLIARNGQPELYKFYFDKKMQEHKGSPQTSTGHVSHPQ